ncbi:efflux RND transporter permease subunit [uncultured Sneathiella sp.]|jgi:multidrug efflux pump|uniref:efflux RND transporter permease subunit n=2 Tax=uncultured Sneathiella sp. TaxID=879315 RepID=UPI0030DB8E9D|tara:strand:+ start:3762 stop:6851 length:3090 start_codon:yes stop_codon:yes gene_type:complete
MDIFEFFIRRPVFSTVMSLIVMLIGLVSYMQLTVREYPNIDEPIVSVRTDYPGASAQIIETQVTQVLEGSIAGIEGIEIISSSSQPEESRITVRFRLGVDPDVSASDVRDRVSRVRGRLPAEVLEPVIAKVEADAQSIIYLAFTSDRHSPIEISDYADRYVRDRLQNIPGVAEVRIFGERRYAMRIWLDRARLAAYKLTAQDVEEALRQQNVEVPAGRIESLDREFTVLSRTGLVTPEQFEKIVIRDIGGLLIRIKDIARVEIGPQDERRVTRFNGDNAVILGIVKQATANPLDVSTAMQEVLPALTGDLPDGMDVTIAYDKSTFIDRSIKAVYTTISEAVALVVIVIFFFLRTIRATIIPLVTIPVSLIGAFALMQMLGFSINTLTLLAMVLAIGLVVDDAIVVLENIHRHVEKGMAPVKAAIVGIREISSAVVAMTLTLAAVYVPVAFAPGRTGTLFTEFALTLAGAVLVSGFVALTLSPMMCSRLLKAHEKHGWLYNFLERGLLALNNGYKKVLLATLRIRPVVVIVALLVAGWSYFLLTGLKSELAPIEDRGVIFTAGNAPEGSTVNFTARYAEEFESLLDKIPEVQHYFAIVGSRAVTELISFSQLTPWEERERTQMEIVRGLQPELSKITGVRAFANNPGSFGQSARSKPIEFVIQTPETYETLDDYVQAFLEEAEKYPGLMNLDSDLRLNKPQLDVEVDRERVADTGAGVLNVGRTLETLLGGRQVTRFNQNGEQYDVIVQMAPDDRRTASDLNDIYVRGRDGTPIQLSNLVSVRETVAPKELNRFNQFRAATITGNIAPGYSLGEGLDALEATARQVLPPTARYDFAGESREFKAAGTSLLFVFLLALGFIFLVLAAQFESFVDPLIIMFTVPLSMTGALLALNLSGGTLNIYSQVGLVTLIGLISKHGILIVQFANQLQDEGKSIHDAVVEAAALRLRPILMTTGAMVSGAIPLALASGAGAESRQEIGWVIVGGMTFGTVLTLFVVPTAYSLLARNRKKGKLEASKDSRPMTDTEALSH